MMIKRILNNQRGSVVVLAALSLMGLIGFAGLVVDVGSLYVEQTKLQNTVDAAVLAGGQALTNTSQATIQANQYITSNGENPANAKVTYSNGNSQINVTITKKVPTFFMGAFGFPTVAVSASASGVVAPPGGPFNYAIFSGSTTVGLPLNGSGFGIKGSVHTNNNLVVNGSSITISGAAEAVGTVTINGSGITVGSTVPKASNIAMPDYSASIAAAAAAANQTYSGSKTINGSSITAGSMYVQGTPGTVTVNGSAFTATGAVMADGGITINGSGVASGNSQVCFYSKNGNITVNGSGINLSGVLYAPNGNIVINGSGITVDGSVVGNQVVINGSGFNVDRTDYPVTSLPSTHVQLTQ